MAAQSQVLRARLHLLRELHAGTRAPGAPICVKDVAGALRLSPTPVREALARLAGEGAVFEAEGRNGFTVPRPGVSGFRQATEVLAHLLDRVLADGRSCAMAPIPCDPVAIAADPVAATEALIGRIVAPCDNPLLVRTIMRLGLVLAPYRRVEPQIMSDWMTGFEQLHAEVEAGRGQVAFAAWWSTRMDQAERIVDAVERPRTTPNIFQI